MTMSRARTAHDSVMFRIAPKSIDRGVNTSAMNLAMETNVTTRDINEKAMLATAHLV